MALSATRPKVLVKTYRITFTRIYCFAINTCNWSLNRVLIKNYKTKKKTTKGRKKGPLHCSCPDFEKQRTVHGWYSTQLGIVTIQSKHQQTDLPSQSGPKPAENTLKWELLQNAEAADQMLSTRTVNCVSLA